MEARMEEIALDVIPGVIPDGISSAQVKIPDCIEFKYAN